MGHELCDGHGFYVLWGISVQRGHLCVGHELCDGNGLHVFLCISVQRGHLCVGHDLFDGHELHVLWGGGVVGFVYSFRWVLVDRWTAKRVGLYELGVDAC